MSSLSPSSAISLLLGAALLSFPWTVASSFQTMFNDFGAASALPLITRIALHPAAPIALGMIVLSLAILGVVDAPKRAWATTVSLLLGLTSLAGLIAGLYQPIFDLAGKIKPE